MYVLVVSKRNNMCKMLHWKFLLVPFLISSLGLLSYSEGANILAVFPIPARSHWTAMQPLLIELAKRGHNLTVVTPFDEKNMPDTWETVLIGKHWNMGGALRPGIFNQSPYSSILRMIFLLYDVGLEMCENVLKEENVQRLIHTEQKTYDLLIMQLFVDECFLAFSHKFNIPIVGMPSGPGFIWTSDSVGNPTPLSYISEGLSAVTDHMTFYERLTNTLMATYQRITRRFYFVPKADAIVRKYFNDPYIPSIADIECNTSLILVNSHISFGYPRPNVPSRVEVGGMHIFPPEKLPKDIQNYLDTCTQGVVYFSMGSNLRSADFPEEKRTIFLNVFSKLKQCVLWKYETDNIPGKPKNVKIDKWLPQTDLLAHKNVQLFITHGGLMSTIEAVSRGVPIIGIPIMADQHANVKRSVSAGIGLQLDFQNITEVSLTWAISELLNNHRYKENVLKRNRIFHDRPIKPLEEAVYWTEYVLRHNGAHHLRSAALDLSWYQYMLLDIVGFLLAVIILICLASVGLIKYLLRMLTGQKHSAQSKKLKSKKND
ncbi:UDP-glycosyltransferase UGT5-like [Schistocerca cancellata]|uniref:UDP-glycosyltransferase UGT5-like n=1 Tax=Schistocerca cancellata TaxID=274614 RepID=UPI0021175066|nr:UDP-glycosyltransferase UGT5-like [Schistocerca cancellata]